jgi:hypothetical protein
VQLRSFTIEEMLGSAAFWTSSLSLAVPIFSVDGRVLARHDSRNEYSEIERFARYLAVLGSSASTIAGAPLSEMGPR